MAADQIVRGGPAADWLDLFIKPGNEARLVGALGLTDSGADQAALAVANDLGLAIADVVAVPPPKARAPKPGEEELRADIARQWQFSELGEVNCPAVILPVAIDEGRGAYEPGQATLSLSRLGDELFIESICDLVALPIDGGRPLSLTGLSLAVGRFAARERGEVEIYAGGLTWLNAHLARAREMEVECPAHLVAPQLDQPEHFATLLLEPKAIEWRPSMAWCALPREAKSIVVRDSLGLAGFIDQAMRRKIKTPALPKVFGPKAGAA